ncbi:MAG: hypothetical protein ACD_29C00191G0002 [uncultured bacterium]|nr:MAG: hypothetical protein ACD_29C00191G0002 [uncultured bacterium]
MSSLKNKIVLITGASRGIGRAIAEYFAKKESIVIGTATTQAGANVISEYLNASGTKGAGFVLDVRDLLAIENAYEQIQAQFGAPNILVNNAGATQDNLLLRMKEEQWNMVIQTNLTAVYYLTKICLRNMMKARFGRIINISSVVATTGNPGQANYCAAKAGMIGFTKAVAAEMASVGVTANVVSPGFVQSDMTDKLNEKQREAILSQIPSKRIGSGSDIAYAVAFLASEKAAYITGQTLHVNGGMCMV